ncbi:MAG TPA: hypothetical protein VLT45_11750 [Kofleriaceae bacterium]|nr:hypothetical protein [Kofleriaceae bacterium]
MTTWRKNEPTPTKREAVLQIWNSSTSLPADRGTDFIALGIVWIRGANTPNLDVAAGTMTNERRTFTSAELTAATFTYTADATTDLITKVAHGLQTGDGAFTTSNTGGALPGGLATLTSYYVIKVSADTFRVATSIANAYANTYVDITSNGSGTNTWIPPAGACFRGMDGRFVYRATQAETNHDANEMEIIIDDGGAGNYALKNSAGGSAVVTMNSDGTDWSGILEGSVTRDMALRILLRGEAAKKTISGATITTRDLADTKNSHHGDVTAAGGRISAVIDDAT